LIPLLAGASGSPSSRSRLVARFLRGARPAGTAGTVMVTAVDRGPNPPEGFRMIVCRGIRSEAPETRSQDEVWGDEHQT
jgi:hypothetical protein